MSVDIDSNRRSCAIALAAGALLWAGWVGAQAPVEDGHRTPDALLDAQQKAGMAYQEWQQAQAARLQADQEYQRALHAYEAAQQQLAITQQLSASAQKKLEAAKSHEALSRKAYDQATRGVDKAWGADKPPK